jgi:NADH dehydrogenase ubiquinone Fe-S protein 4
LMGWTSAGDTLNELKLRFDTLDEAVAYAKKNSLDYSVIEPQDFKFRPKSYSDNFRWQRPR